MSNERETRGTDSQQRMVGPQTRMWHERTNCRVCSHCNGFGRVIRHSEVNLCQPCFGTGFENLKDAAL